MDTRHSAPLTLGHQTGRSLHQILAAYCQSTDVAYAALLEESGMVCADAGDEKLRDHGEMAALAVGAYHATQQVALRLGETGFEGLSHEGKNRHFYLSPVDARFILLSIFTNDTRLAIVRAGAQKTGNAMCLCLSEAQAPPADPVTHEIRTSPTVHEGDILIARDYFLPLSS